MVTEFCDYCARPSLALTGGNTSQFFHVAVGHLFGLVRRALFFACTTISFWPRFRFGAAEHTEPWSKGWANGPKAQRERSRSGVAAHRALLRRR